MTSLTVKTPMRALFLKTSTTCMLQSTSAQNSSARPGEGGGGGVRAPKEAVNALNKKYI